MIRVLNLSTGRTANMTPEERLKEIKWLHEKVQHKNKMRKLADDLGLKVARAEISLEQALAETRKALENHPAILAHMARN